MKSVYSQLYRGTIFVLVAMTLAASVFSQDRDADSSEVFDLSPFVITSEEDTGYAATNTLAGTRLRSDLKDLAGAVQVVTEEFLEDTGSTNAEDLFLYTTSTEVAGPDGNFGNGGADRRDSNGSTRVRGLAEPDRTRGYFLSDIGFDTYNTDRVTIAKGPNAILFGLGSPAGIVNNNLKQAVFEDQTEIKLRYGSWGAHREILDLNRVLFDDFMALRIIGLNNKNKFKQKPSFEDEQRLYAALLVKPFKKTTIRANIEIGARDASRPFIITPNSNIPDWVANGMPTASDPVNSPGFSIIPSNRAPQFILDSPGATKTSVGFDPEPGTTGPDGQRRFHYTWMNREDSAADVSNAVLSDEDSWVFDFRNNTLTGLDNTSSNSFDATNITLEQEFSQDAGIELVFDKQNTRSNWLDRAQNTVNVDASEFLPYFVSDGAGGVMNVPNPNVGRPMLPMNEGLANEGIEREAFRVTAYYDLDLRDSDNFSWLGRHVFTGLFSDQSREVTNSTTANGSVIAGEGERILEANRNQDFTTSSWDRHLRGTRYLGPRITGANATAAVRPSVITPRIQDFTAVFYDSTANPIVDGHSGAYREVSMPVILDPINSASIDRQEIESLAITAQSYLLDDHIVATYGWRQDDASSWRDDDPDQTIDAIALPETLQLPSSPDDTTKDDVFTWGVVGHVPEQWLAGIGLSLHYGESENFVPSPGRITVMNEPHPSPAGNTTEYGFSFNLPDQKFYVRVNWFETFSKNQTDDSLGDASLAGWERLFYNNIRNDLQELEEKVPGDPSQGYWPNNIGWEDVYTLPPLGFREAYWNEVNPDPSPGGTPTVSDHPNPNVTGVSDFASEGVEVEGVWNPTENWTFMFNVAQQKVIKTNVLKSYLKYFEIREPQWLAMGHLIPRPNTYKNPKPQTMFERTRNVQWRRLLAQTTKEGALLDEIREWRFNLATNYRFDNDGALKGYAVGAAYRWQDEVAVGFRDREATGSEFGVAGIDEIGIVDVTQPLFGPTESNLDLWINYSRKIFDGKVDWKLQLNIRNALNNDDLIITSKDADDVPARIRIMNPINFRLTSTFSF